jgi:hypothetical protein
MKRTVHSTSSVVPAVSWESRDEKIVNKPAIAAALATETASKIIGKLPSATRTTISRVSSGGVWSTAPISFIAICARRCAVCDETSGARTAAARHTMRSVRCTGAG